ncbi:MAG: tetratricopeptide repeat protein [Planctomycetes bacterium]|nr:tetratricopeptide repeat protein [Planctomycetota bacterium]
MEVPFRLTRREVPTAADAYLLFATDATPLVDACVRLGGEAPPAVFAVRGGFVVMPPYAETRTLPGAIRLRRIGGDLFIPADADLVPSLLLDETAVLSQKRGLIVLPGGEVLSFIPTPLPVTKWLAPICVRRDEWQSFPPRPDRPETLSVIERPSPPASLMEMLGEGAPDDANPLSDATGVPEDARPPASGSTLSNLAANVNLAVGGFLTWLGKQLGASGLARLGGNLARKALEAVPRLSEKVLGQQEAALREVLRQLQSGDIEKGLRRAPIAVGDPDQPAKVGTNARLGNRDPRYSLRDLIGTGGGSATTWLGGGDIWNELAREYRKLAEEATARGDFRRAAYLYGVLLRDLRSAANVLMAGGLCRDAALLYRDRLNDPLAAANAFERAGDHDEALRLFEKYEHFEKAAELLRRIGDEDRAVAYYVRAADLLAKRGFLLGAGDLIRMKAGRRDLAIGYYERGWNGISAEVLSCGERLLDEHLIAEDMPRVQELLTDAEARLADRASDAGHFFNYALDVGKPFLSPEMRDDLTDRVRLLFAAHLRSTGSSTEGVRLARELFGQNQPWPGPVVRDASFAVLHKDRVPPVVAAPKHSPPVKLGNGTVTAVAVARGTADIVVATEQAVVLWRVDENRVVLVTPLTNGPIFALSVNSTGEIVYGLQDRGTVALWCFEAESKNAFRSGGVVDDLSQDSQEDSWYLQPSPAIRNHEYRITVHTPVLNKTYIGPNLKRDSTDVFLTGTLETHLLVETAETRGDIWEWSDGLVRHWTRSNAGNVGFPSSRWHAPWNPLRANVGGVVDWIAPGTGILEVAGIDTEGCLHWARFSGEDNRDPGQRDAHRPPPDRYVAACLTGSGAVVAVNAHNEVNWFRVAGTSLEVTATLTLDVPTPAVTLVARPAQNEVVAILADSSAIRFKNP